MNTLQQKVRCDQTENKRQGELERGFARCGGLARECLGFGLWVNICLISQRMDIRAASGACGLQGLTWLQV